MASFPVDLHPEVGDGRRHGYGPSGVDITLHPSTRSPIAAWFSAGGQLLVADVCLSGTPGEGLGLLCGLMPICFATGKRLERCGAIAALDEVSPRHVDILKLQRSLTSQGAILPENH